MKRLFDYTMHIYMYKIQRFHEQAVLIWFIVHVAGRSNVTHRECSSNKLTRRRSNTASTLMECPRDAAAIIMGRRSDTTATLMQCRSDAAAMLMRCRSDAAETLMQ